MQLDRDYPALRAEGGGISTARSLAARAHILPVLDGLDELPNAARAKVITALNRSLGADDQLILTSRTSEFVAAIEEKDNVLRSAAVIESLALSPEVAASYLENCLPPQPDAEWTSILANLRQGRARALAEVTSTPLGVWLLRTVYIDTGRSAIPLRRKHLRDPDALRRHLFGELIPALVSIRTPTDNAAEIYRPRRVWRPDDITRWLGFHAWNLKDLNAAIAEKDASLDPVRDFTWWHLAGLTMHPFTIGLLVGVAGLAGGLIYGSGMGIQFGVVLGPQKGLIAALVFGPGLGLLGACIVGMLAGTKWLNEKPGYADLRIRRRRSAARRHAVADRSGSRIISWIKSPIGMALSVAFVIGGIGATGGAVVAPLTAGLIAGFIIWLAAWILMWAESPAANDRAITPISSWRADRTLILLRVSLVALAFGLAFGLGAWLLVGGIKHAALNILTSVLLGAGIGLILGVIMGNHHAWLLFVPATFRVALLGHWLPFRLMPFLDDCHRLGLLRTVGPTYQYRHAELQDYLAVDFQQKYRNYLR
jgi:hypothetical protein